MEPIQIHIPILQDGSIAELSQDNIDSMSEEELQTVVDSIQSKMDDLQTQLDQVQPALDLRQSTRLNQIKQ